MPCDMSHTIYYLNINYSILKIQLVIESNITINGIMKSVLYITSLLVNVKENGAFVRQTGPHIIGRN